MSTTWQDLYIAARRKLVASPYFTPLLGVDVGVEPNGGTEWVFKSSDSVDSPEKSPENTGLSSVVLAQRQSWTGPNDHNSLEFPELEFHILSDRTRISTDGSLPRTTDADFRCDRVAKAIRNTFHIPANNHHWWPNDVYVISSLAWSNLQTNYIEDGDGLIAGTLTFALQIG